MAQWHKLLWDPEKIRFLGEIRLHPHEDGKTVKASHDLHPWHELDWSKESAQDAESGAQMHHLHDGVVSHIRVLPQVRGKEGAVSVHALWHDKDGKIVRQDAHMQFP